MDKSKVVSVLKVVSKIIAIAITALGGGALATCVAGCKMGSLISLAAPAF